MSHMPQLEVNCNLCAGPIRGNNVDALAEEVHKHYLTCIRKEEYQQKLRAKGGDKFENVTPKRFRQMMKTVARQHAEKERDAILKDRKRLEERVRHFMESDPNLRIATILEKMTTAIEVLTEAVRKIQKPVAHVTVKPADVTVQPPPVKVHFPEPKPAVVEFTRDRTGRITSGTVRPKSRGA